MLSRVFFFFLYLFCQTNSIFKKIISNILSSFKIRSSNQRKTVHERLDLSLERDSIFYKLGSYGLISFSDYIFLLTVLSSEFIETLELLVILASFIYLIFVCLFGAVCIQVNVDCHRRGKMSRKSKIVFVCCSFLIFK